MVEGSKTIADNKTSDLSAWDHDLSADKLSVLKVLDVDLSSLGIDDDDLAKLLGGDVTERQSEPDEIPEGPDEAITQPGDLRNLGEYRLVYRDSASYG